MAFFNRKQTPVKPAATPPPEAPADPLAQIAALLQQQNERLTAMENKTATPPAAPDATPQNNNAAAIPPMEIPEVTVTQDAIAKAFEDGDYALAAKLTTQHSVESAARAAAQAAAPIQQTGFMALTAIAQDNASKTYPHYNRFKTEIDAQLSRVDPSMRALPEAQKWAYEAVVGSHLPELNAEAVEAFKKEQEEAASHITPTPEETSFASRFAPPDGKVKPEDIWNENELKTLHEMGQDPDSLAAEMGYDNFDDYYEKAIKPYQTQNH